MGLPYLPNRQSWAEITREERYFCSELYHDFKARPLDLVDLINEKLKDKLPVNTHWELGFEVCFYRDFIHHRKLKEGGPSIGEIEVAIGTEKDRKTRFPFKRTFDLCLFGETHIVIIEAKVHQGYDTKQLEEFDLDRKFLNQPVLFGDYSVPEIVLIGLHSSNYCPKPNTLSHFDNGAFLTWNEIASKARNAKQSFHRADEIRIELSDRVK